MYANDMSLSLKSDTFSALKEDFDVILARTIGNMEMKGAEDATITLKLGISLEKSSVSGPSGIRDIVKPSFKHDISSVMQVKDKKSGALTGDYEMVWDAGEAKYVMRRIDNGQTSMFDEESDETVIDVNYTPLLEDRRSLPEAGSGDSADIQDECAAKGTVEHDSADNGNTSPFEWLKQFVGQRLRVTEALGNYTVRTEDNKIVLSSATGKDSAFYCPPEKLEGHVGHKVFCAGRANEEGVIDYISIDCEDCQESLFEIAESGIKDEDVEGYEYDDPESDEEND